MNKYKDLEYRLNREAHKMNWKVKNNKGWKVKIDRQEEIYGDPSLYYTDQEVLDYSRSGGMRRAQEKIAFRIIELMNLPKGAKLLDIGCGAVYTTFIYKQNGYNVTGLDILPKMLEYAKKDELKVIQGDMRDLQDLFPKGGIFDGVVSASALQWLKYKPDLDRVFEGINHVLVQNGRAVIQFYPKSEEELNNTFKFFKKNSFDGEIVVDNPDNPMKRAIYLVMKKI